jgi:DNA-directed RNA polymerase specialized sigma24 family protein
MNDLSWLEPELTEAEPDPFVALVAAERRRALRRAFADLPRNERYVLERLYRDGWTLREIARSMQRSTNPVITWHSMGVMRLGGLLRRERELFESTDTP